ncbi:MAG: hypothetical protein ACREMB_27525 [Candidatus Rokuibacteriota bacterium]
MKTRLGAIAVLTFVLAGCASYRAVPMRSEFLELPLPEGLAYQADDSTIIESPTVRAARLVYRGRVEPGSLAVAVQNTLETGGWRLVRNSYAAGPGTAQAYERGDASLAVRIWEGGLFGWYTYVELTGSRSTSARASTAVR